MRLRIRVPSRLIPRWYRTYRQHVESIEQDLILNDYQSSPEYAHIPLRPWYRPLHARLIVLCRSLVVLYCRLFDHELVADDLTPQDKENGTEDLTCRRCGISYHIQH